MLTLAAKVLVKDEFEIKKRKKCLCWNDFLFCIRRSNNNIDAIQISLLFYLKERFVEIMIYNIVIEVQRCD